MKKILVLVTSLIISNHSYSQNNEVVVDKIYSESIEKLIDIGFNGYAMGGLAVGEKQVDMFEILSEEGLN